jgi:hypothetical protein
MSRPLDFRRPYRLALAAHCLNAEPMSALPRATRSRRLWLREFLGALLVLALALLLPALAYVVMAP